MCGLWTIYQIQGYRECNNHHSHSKIILPISFLVSYILDITYDITQERRAAMSRLTKHDVLYQYTTIYDITQHKKKIIFKNKNILFLMKQHYSPALPL